MYKYISIIFSAGASIALTGCKNNSDGGREAAIKTAKGLVKKYGDLSKGHVTRDDMEKLKKNFIKKIFGSRTRCETKFCTRTQF